jgi:putative oxidoreductase
MGAVIMQAEKESAMKDLGLLLLRIVAGGTLAAHGYTKLFGGEGSTPPQALTRLFGPNFAKAVESGGPGSFAKMLEGMSVPYPTAGAYAAGLAEFGGGLALLTGTRTRLAALAVMANMAVAIRKAHWQNGFYGQGGYEFPLQLLTAAATLFIAGPGAISVDGMVAGARAASDAVDSGAQRVAEAAGSGAQWATGAVGSGAHWAAETAGSGARAATGKARRARMPW